MNVKEVKTDNLSPLAQDANDAIKRTIENAYQNAQRAVFVDYEIPEGFIRIPKENVRAENRLAKKADGVNSGIKVALSAALPASLTALALAFQAPAVAVVILSSAGGIIDSFIQPAGKSDMKLSDLSELQLETLSLEKLTKEDVRVTLETDGDKLEEAKRKSMEEADKLCRELSDFEETMRQRHDVAVDRTFGEWVQRFLIYVQDHSEDRELQIMKSTLIDRLEDMNISVYDELELDKDGHPAVPFPACLIDKSDGNGYEVVTKPAVYSDRQILARGVIK